MNDDTITKRIDNITKIPENYLSRTPPAPKSVKIEITGRCNYRCSFCALAHRVEQPKGNMDFELFKRISKEMKEAGVTEIGLFYLGESFMAPDLLIKCIEYLKQDVQMPYVFLTTNGSLATPKAVDAAMRAGLNSLKWSVNSATPEQFAEIMQVKESLFDKALDNLKEAKAIRDANGHKCKIYASSIKYNGDQHEKMKALLNERVIPYVDEHYWLPLYSMAAVATETVEALGYRPTAGNIGRLGAIRDPLPCWAVFTEGHVTASGKLSACCFDADGRFAMADLNDVSFTDGWKSIPFQELRKAHLAKNVTNTICQNCIAYAH